MAIHGFPLDMMAIQSLTLAALVENQGSLRRVPPAFRTMSLVDAASGVWDEPMASGNWGKQLSSVENLCWLMIMGDYTIQYIWDDNPIKEWNERGLLNTASGLKGPTRQVRLWQPTL